jgi:antitoxin component YwqK of YwqJK toxin-antitoxin module
MTRILIIAFLFIFQVACDKKQDFKNELWDNSYPKTRVTKGFSPVDGELTIVTSYEKEDSNICFVEQYYDNGQLDSKGKFFYGEKDGLWLSWYKNGQKSIEENYDKGSPKGLYRSWLHDGSVLEEIEYK